MPNYNFGDYGLYRYIVNKSFIKNVKIDTKQHRNDSQVRFLNLKAIMNHKQ